MTDRRSFIKKTGFAAAAITIVPRSVLGGSGHKAPSDKLNIAGIGIGGKGHPNLKGMATENIVALCDVDWKYSEPCFRDFPSAKKYWVGRCLMN